MLALDESYVDAAAPNADAAKNGRALMLKKRFLNCHLSGDQTMLFGQCQGSGKVPYDCSCDFLRPESPVHRCSCPSRQFPCKHCIGLMYAYVQNAKAFTIAEVPDALQAKREKAEVRAEKKKEESAKPKKVNKSALTKKIHAQLEGINLLEQMTQNLVRIGIGNMNAKSIQEIEDRAKQLGDAYLPGAQSALRSYTRLFATDDGDFNDSMSATAWEMIYSDALDQLTRLSAMVKQGRSYLEKRLADPELRPETDSSIAAWLGHAWQLTELQEAGFVQQDVELLQLAFNTHDDAARMEMIDTGIWVEIRSGKVYTTKNYRPYHAIKFIKEEDSFFQIAQVERLYVYPGDMNQRVRWQNSKSRAVEPKDYAAIDKQAHADFATLTKAIKNNLKAPLAEKQPVCLLRFKQIGVINDQFVVEDHTGNRITLTDQGIREEPCSLQLLPFLPPDSLRDQTLVGRFRHDLDTRRLEVKPLGIVTEHEIIRLTL